MIKPVLVSSPYVFAGGRFRLSREEHRLSGNLCWLAAVSLAIAGLFHKIELLIGFNGLKLDVVKYKLFSRHYIYRQPHWVQMTSLCWKKKTNPN
jgi:hypothetical protein